MILPHVRVWELHHQPVTCKRVRKHHKNDKTPPIEHKSRQEFVASRLVVCLFVFFSSHMMQHFVFGDLVIFTLLNLQLFWFLVFLCLAFNIFENKECQMGEEHIMSSMEGAFLEPTKAHRRQVPRLK